MNNQNKFYAAYKQSLVEKFVQYMIDSKYRTIVGLKSWIKDQVDNPSKLVLLHAQFIKDCDNPDTQVVEVFRYVAKHLKYTSDINSDWKMPEKWQTAEETLQRMKGDCEDGAVLTYVLCRLKGVPANRLIIYAGNVYANNQAQQGGHCWFSYRTDYYGAHAFLDWCYYPNKSYLPLQNKFYVIDKDIVEFDYNTNYEVDSKYYKIWFGFNEEISFTTTKV